MDRLARTAALVIASALALPALADEQPQLVDGQNADNLLKPGDVLIKFLGPTTKISRAEILIEQGQKAIQRARSRFHKELKQGDPRAFHVAIYLGAGKTAEAHGGDLKTAHVGLRKLDDHAGYVFQVYRPKDAALGTSAAKVAEVWAAPNRMKYLIPSTAPFHLSSFGTKAKKEALDYGRSADRAGGPADVKKMFCSEFVIASYQAAIIKGELAKDAKLDARHLTMPVGLDIQASHASPLAFHAHLNDAVKKGAWTHVGEVLVKP